MEPVIQVGDEVLLDEVPLSALKKFDIVVFREGDKYTCHYIWHINQHLKEGLITTRNLDGYHFDDSFHYDKIVGRVRNYHLSLWIKFKLLFWIK